MTQVSIIIRTYNEQEKLGMLLETIHQQDYAGQVEVIVVDSGSTDRTVDIAQTFSAHIIHIDKASFNYGKALNLGIQNSSGGYIVILSGHSVPSSTHWLKAMIESCSSPDIAGVYCKQEPWPNARWDEIRRLKKTFPDQSHRFSLHSNDHNMSFSNAASCIKRSFWENHNFAQLPAAEDQEWALWAINQGNSIVYNADISVFHSHNDPPYKAAYRKFEIEANLDIKNGRRRTRFFTILQALHSGIKEFLAARNAGVRGKELFGESRHIIKKNTYYVHIFWKK